MTTPTNFDKKNTGVTIEVTPIIEPDGKVIDLSLTWSITNFDGFVDADGKPVPTNEKGIPEKMPDIGFPVFDTRSVSTVATLSSGATVVFSRDEEHHFAQKSLRFAMGEKQRQASPAEDADRLLLVFVTATLVDPAGIGGTDDHPSAPGAPLAPGMSKKEEAAQPSNSPAPSSAPVSSADPATPTSLPYGYLFPASRTM